uniref:Uncharacterized protein n=1 Tax=Caenorhabditis japonica TaxID=281687 RepID=A0A8R1IC77_CAEJA
MTSPDQSTHNQSDQNVCDHKITTICPISTRTKLREKDDEDDKTIKDQSLFYEYFYNDYRSVSTALNKLSASGKVKNEMKRLSAEEKFTIPRYTTHPFLEKRCQ